MTWNIRNTSDYKNYSAIIMADPQALASAEGDPDAQANRTPWLEVNGNVAKAIASHKVSFGIVYGDPTKFGRQSTCNDQADICKNTSIPIFEGLGNHDYANNAGNCATNTDWSTNGCARSAVRRYA